ncbi:Zn(2)-C6 fungal-type domain-containing protein [Fusarium falciforme]|uniref:Zn(2)-C6 fungal-type domain-containing protein n=1 Tax=Fusarium falciforme TaxID=195108 RepID=UPI002301AA43|nr:Zn(2)-C6 fungal-type domain-containing protein [Fusarium falciforme]WAO96644.1 Zn(2)-C6 fungal-type domain-containing protein [Fusarium falciforme]
MRSSDGCWTCRLRRKKCDEIRPVCDTCSALNITCYFTEDKPEWMDGGPRQEEMAEKLRKEVKEQAYRRRPVRERLLHTSLPRIPPRDLNDTPSRHKSLPDGQPEAKPSLEVTPHPRRGTDCILTAGNANNTITFSRPDTFLLTFYLDNLLPFLFPFYNPSLLEGGKAWILEMMISSPVVRQATRCQSSYFFSLAQGQDADWKTVLEQTRDSFSMLGKSLQVIQGSNIMEHVHGAIRILAGIMQLQRYEASLLSFDNCQAHLNGAVALFKQLLDNAGSSDPRSNFSVVLSRLGPSSHIAERLEVPSAEQSAFRFSSALLMFDDIVASTVLQQKPKLYEYHQSLLDNVDEAGPAVDLERVVGCQNWVLAQTGEIASLDAWKQNCKRAGNLDMMEMVRIAKAIKTSLETQLTGLEATESKGTNERQRHLNVLTGYDEQQSKTRAAQSSLVTKIWAHGALIYLSVVVSGWQPASVDIRYNVEGILKLVESPVLPRALLRTMVWPFCVAGCLAEPAQERRFRAIVEELQPLRVFGTVCKALEIMEKVWRDRQDTGRDLATCFKGHGDLVLLV